jgi:hypothetical protein
MDALTTAMPADLPETGPAAPRPPSAFVDQLLRAPNDVLRALGDGADLAARTRVYLVAVLACTATFGAALGFFRGGVQILFAAVKLPLATLLTLAVLVPLLHALNRALERPADIARDVAALMAAMARAALVLAAETPLLWAAHAVDVDYHHMIVLAVLTCGAAGLVGAWFLWRALSVERRGRLVVTALLLGTMAVVGTHSAWLFRPFIVRPRAERVVFMHPLEGSFSDAVEESLDSARGHYRSHYQGSVP